MDSFQLTDTAAAESETLPAAEPLPLSTDKPQKKEKGEYSYSLIAENTADFFGGSRLCLLARRSARITAGEIRLSEDPIETVIPSEDEAEEADPEEEASEGEEKEEEEDPEATPEEDEYTDEDEYFDYEYLDDEDEDEEDEEISEEEFEALFDFLSKEDPHEDLRLEEETKFEEILAADETKKDWVREYFANCEKLEKTEDETAGCFLLQQARKICRTLGVRFRKGDIVTDPCGVPLESDALPAVLLASAAALLGTTDPCVTFSFSIVDGEPIIKLLLTSKKGKADTEFFNGIRHYVERTGIYFSTAPHPRGFFAEICATRTDPSLLGLKSPVVFSVWENR